MQDKPSVATTESAKNPNGQGATMASAPVGKPAYPHPELNSRPCEVISPTKAFGVKQMESHGG